MSGAGVHANMGKQGAATNHRAHGLGSCIALLAEIAVASRTSQHTMCSKLADEGGTKEAADSLRPAKTLTQLAHRSALGMYA